MDNEVLDMESIMYVYKKDLAKALGIIARNGMPMCIKCSATTVKVEWYNGGWFWFECEVID